MRTVDIINYAEERGLSKDEAFDLIKENQLYTLAFEEGHFRPNLEIDETLLLKEREIEDLIALAKEIDKARVNFEGLKSELKTSKSTEVLNLDKVEVTIDGHSLDVAHMIVEREHDWIERTTSDALENMGNAMGVQVFR